MVGDHSDPFFFPSTTFSETLLTTRRPPPHPVIAVGAFDWPRLVTGARAAQPAFAGCVDGGEAVLASVPAAVIQPAAAVITTTTALSDIRAAVADMVASVGKAVGMVREKGGVEG